jgi:hypothetical protein
MNTVYPIGYNLAGADRRIEQLMQDPLMKIIDCRIVPHSRCKPEYNRQALEHRWNRQAKRYHWAGQFLGNAAHEENLRNRGRMIWDKPYPRKIRIANPEVGVAGLARYLEEQYDLILLCGCTDYEGCHLKAIVSLLCAARPSVQIVLKPESVSSTQQYNFPNGAKVYAKLKGRKVPAIVLESRWSQNGNYDQVRLRAAQRNELTRTWIVSELPKPVQSYKLTKRATYIVELDGLEETGIKNDR